MIKKIKFNIVDILLNMLIFALLILLIAAKVNPIINYQVYSFFKNVGMAKNSNAQIQTYSEINHPECFLTKEALNNKKNCLNNNGSWLYNSKTCLCKPIEII